MKTTSNNLLLAACAAGVISEKLINLLKNRKTNGENIDMDPLYDLSDGLKLEPDHNKKGFDFLFNLYKTPTGAVRKNSSFGCREIEVLENFENFTFNGFYDAGNGFRSFYVPIYICNGAGGSFEYYYMRGSLNIIG